MTAIVYLTWVPRTQLEKRQYLHIRVKFDASLLLYVKLNFICIRDLNVTSETQEVVEENIGRTL